MKVLVPKTDTSGKQIKQQFTRSQFIYDAKNDEYRCPAGERLPFKSIAEVKGRKLRVYRTFKCPDCRLKAQCTPAKDRRIQRWEHEHALEAAEADLKKNPGCDAITKTDRGAPLRHDQTLDGIDALFNEGITEGSNGDESSRTGIQHETGD